MEFTKELACRLASITFAQIPEAARSSARMAITDGVGVAIGGGSEEVSRLVLKSITPGGPCALIGTDKKAAPHDAAFYNGVAMHASDYDDLSSIMMGHPTAALLPAALAAAEVKKSSGKALIRGYVLGVETAATLARLVNPDHYRAGWHATSTLGTLGAAVSAGIVLGLDDEALMRAMGVATSMASGSRQNFGSMTKPLQVGNASRAGAQAALFAAEGLTANTSIIEAQFGFTKLFGGCKEPDYVKAMNAFARPFEVEKPGITIKRYPCCAGTHAAVDAALILKEQNDIDAKKIDDIEVGVNRMIPDILIHNRPKTPLEAKFSMQYCIAAALVRGKLGMREFTEETLSDGDVRELMKNVRMVPHDIAPVGEDDSPFRTAVVKITIDGGETVEMRVDDPRGSPANPLNLGELLAKFEDVAAPIGEGAVQKAWEALNMIEDMEHIDDLASAIIKK